MAKLQTIETPAGFLAPIGRANQQIHVEEAHSCGEFLASKGSPIVCTEPEGEVGIALLTGAISTGGQVKIYSDPAHEGIARLKGHKLLKLAVPRLKEQLQMLAIFGLCHLHFLTLNVIWRCGSTQATSLYCAFRRAMNFCCCVGLCRRLFRSVRRALRSV